MEQSKLNVETLGQVFTPKRIVNLMISWIKNNGLILEPSCGDGAFSDELKNCTCIEFDSNIAPKNALIMDFFDFPISNKYSTIIGNPPYVKYQDIIPETLRKISSNIFDERTNLNLFFIEKCIKHLKKHGELIFIVPRDFMKSTSAIKLNEWMYSIGTITNWYETGDQKIFNGACPNCVIFRFEKDNFSRICNNDKIYKVEKGQIYILDNNIDELTPFSDLFFVKVGAVSGDDQIFTNDNGNLNFVCSKTCKTGELKKMFYNIENDELFKYKDRLISRKIAKFDNTNWYMWGRKFYKSDKKRIYVNGKTRCKKPFFINDCTSYDGSILAIFPRKDVTSVELQLMCKKLNEMDWNKLGFVVDGRYIFSQRSLENSLISW